MVLFPGTSDLFVWEGYHHVLPEQNSFMKIATGVSLEIVEFDRSISPIYSNEWQKMLQPIQKRYESASTCCLFFFFLGWGVHVSCEIIDNKLEAIVGLRLGREKMRYLIKTTSELEATGAGLIRSTPFPLKKTHSKKRSCLKLISQIIYEEYWWIIRMTLLFSLVDFGYTLPRTGFRIYQASSLPSKICGLVLQVHGHGNWRVRHMALFIGD